MAIAVPVDEQHPSNPRYDLFADAPINAGQILTTDLVPCAGARGVLINYVSSVQHNRSIYLGDVDQQYTLAPGGLNPANTEWAGVAASSGSYTFDPGAARYCSLGIYNADAGAGTVSVSVFVVY